MLASQLKMRMVSCQGKQAGLAKSNLTKIKAASMVNPETMDKLQRMLHDINPYYHTFMALGNIDPKLIEEKQLVLKADARPPNDEHVRQWNLPENNEVAIIDLTPESTQPADIILHQKGGNIQHISSNHRSFEALHYTLLFPHGDDGSVINYQFYIF